MSSNTPLPSPVARVRSFQSHKKPDQLRFEFAGEPFTPGLIDSDRRLVLEIGCGVGWHPVQLAKQWQVDRDSASLLIAVERTKMKFDSFRNRLLHHEDLQKSICAVHGDAYQFVDLYFTNSRLDEVWLLYPNPEVKRPGLRWYNAPAFQRIQSAMKPGALFHFATNLQDFAREGLTKGTTLGLEVVSHNEISNQSTPDFNPRSHFEKKYFERGEIIYSTQFRSKKI